MFEICDRLSIFKEFESVYGEVYSKLSYVIKFVSDLRQVGGFLKILQFPPPIKWLPRYNWNTVQSVVKHHNPNSTFLLITYLGHYGHKTFEDDLLSHISILSNQNVFYKWYIFISTLFFLVLLKKNGICIVFWVSHCASVHIMFFFAITFNRRNLSTYYWKFSTQLIQRKKKHIEIGSKIIYDILYQNLYSVLSKKIYPKALYIDK